MPNNENLNTLNLSAENKQNSSIDTQNQSEKNKKRKLNDFLGDNETIFIQ